MANLFFRPYRISYLLLWTFWGCFWGGCAGDLRAPEFYREVSTKGIQVSSDTIYWIPLRELKYDLQDTCATLKKMLLAAKDEKSILGEGGQLPTQGGCLATGSSNALFDFNSALQKALLANYENVREIYPGRGGVPEGALYFDDLVDSLGIALKREMNDFQVVEVRQFCYDNSLAKDVRFYTGRLFAEYQKRFVWIPFDVEVAVWANEGGSGRVQWSYGLSLWDLQTPSLLYVAHQKEDFYTANGENVDKEIFARAEHKLFDDFKYLQDSLSIECAKESR